MFRKKKHRNEIPVHTGCTNCGTCCYGGGVFAITKSEIADIRQYLNADPTRKQEIKNVYFDHKIFKSECKFRDIRNKRCSIHPVRPTVCRLMGVTEGMSCRHGNTDSIDGKKFISRLEYLCARHTLNNVKWF